MDTPPFDIFYGELDRDPLWVEAAPSLDEACNRMRERAQARPGRYFVYCCHTQKLLDSIDTTPAAEPGNPQPA